MFDRSSVQDQLSARAKMIDASKMDVISLMIRFDRFLLRSFFVWCFSFFLVPSFSLVKSKKNSLTVVPKTFISCRTLMLVIVATMGMRRLSMIWERIDRSGALFVSIVSSSVEDKIRTSVSIEGMLANEIVNEV